MTCFNKNTSLNISRKNIYNTSNCLIICINYNVSNAFCNWGGDLFTNEKEIEKNTVETNTAPKGNIFGKPTTKKVEAQTSEEISKTLDEIIKNNPTKGDV